MIQYLILFSGNRIPPLIDCTYEEGCRIARSKICSQQKNEFYNLNHSWNDNDSFKIIEGMNFMLLIKLIFLFLFRLLMSKYFNEMFTMGYFLKHFLMRFVMKVLKTIFKFFFFILIKSPIPP